ncbi:MAG: M28 family peptidase [Anaerolineales bacterium]|nr:M28 family peptidase [Anaerolineales bacterium]
MGTIDHVRHLVETIGPRGSTTAKEAEASQYAAKVLQEVGLDPTIEPFRSARSAYYPFVLFTAAMLVSALLHWFAGRWGSVGALILATLAFVSVLLELAFRGNPLRWVLPKGHSQNVWAKIPPRDQPGEKIILIGHVDSHRTPLIFSSERWLRLFRVLIPIGVVSALALIALFAIGVASPVATWRLLFIPFALVLLGIFLLTLQADLTPYSPGANDNASGVAVVLSLAERLKSEPLTQASVWVVLSGCEEVGCYGADAFARTHLEELRNAVWIAVDSVGGAHTVPAYQTQETFLLTTHSDQGLLEMARHVTKDNPELGIHPYKLSGAYTEAAIGAIYGFRVITMISFRMDGTVAEWHRPTDVVENVDLDVLDRSERFLWELVREIDRNSVGEAQR